jgi:hypothetical protein
MGQRAPPGDSIGRVAGADAGVEKGVNPDAGRSLIAVCIYMSKFLHSSRRLAIPVAEAIKETMACIILLSP